MVGDGPPLYVIDDAHIVVDPGVGINWLEPEDIIQIRVLKTPAETSVYGPRGVNGVILITTKLAVGRRK
jgi:TonB-dependent SusC/RagA subfamily outer membrane receptor